MTDCYNIWRSTLSQLPFKDVLPRGGKIQLKIQLLCFQNTKSLPEKTQIFLNCVSFSTPILHAPGTAQIGEGIENSWGDLEESEREDAAEEEGESEATTLECQKMETEDASTMRETEDTSAVKESKKGKYLSLISDMLITSLH